MALGGGRARPFRIRFGGRKPWHRAIDLHIDRRTFHASYGPLDNIDPDAFDVVVPLHLDDYPALRNRAELAAKAIMPSAAVVALCDDKLALDTALAGYGFGDLSPGAPGPNDPAFPYVAKGRRGGYGRATRIIRSRDDEQAAAAFLAQPDVFRQAYVDGDCEYAAHMLMRRGRLLFQLTMRHDMAAPFLVKGLQAKPRQSSAIGPPDPHAERFASLLAAIGYEGTACIDYKIAADGTPKIMEINPRAGASLRPSVDLWLDAYLMALGLTEPRTPAAERAVARRRLWARRLRRLGRRIGLLRASV